MKEETEITVYAAYINGEEYDESGKRGKKKCGNRDDSFHERGKAAGG